MIVSNAPRIGNAVRAVALPLSILFLWDVVVTIIYLHGMPDMGKLELPLSLFGTAIALFVGFAVNAAYARWWEARGNWGGIVNASRNLARQALTLCDEPASTDGRAVVREMIRSQIAYVNVLRTSLRGEPLPSEATTYLSADAVRALGGATNAANAILLRIGRLAAEARKAGMLDAFARVRIETTLADCTNAQGAIERIKATPLPSQYRFFPSLFARVFCVLLPFAVVQDLGVVTPVGSTLVGLMFLIAVQIGLDLMDPFANGIHDVPMTALCRTIEIDLLQMMGETAPEKIAPRDGVLW